MGSKPETPRQVLEAIKYLIRDERHWCQGTMSKPRLFFRQRCVYGSLNTVGNRMIGKKGVDFPLTHPPGYAHASLYLERVASALWGDSFVRVNDKRGFGATHDMLDEAIRMAERIEIKHLDFPVAGVKPVPYVLSA
jgi:hypothetical protein